METSAVLKPLAGWYSSHWSIAPASVVTRPFTISSSSRVNQPLAGLQELYARAAFLLGIISGLPAEKTAPAAENAAPPEATRQTPVQSNEAAHQPVPPTSRSSRVNIQPQSSPAAGAFKPRWAPDSAASPPPSEPEVEPEAVPETFAAVADKAEVLIEAVNRLAEALKAHEFLSSSMREYGAEMISRFGEALAPYGLGSTGGSFRLDREKLAGAYQENSQQVAEAFWGPNSLTPDITSLAVAIVGAPGACLLEAAPQTPQTYQPSHALNPWFRVAPAGFYQVA